MSVDASVALLQRIPIFARLSQSQIAEIVRKAEKVKFRSGQCITEAGNSGDGAYLLVSGHAEREAAPEQPLPPGSLIGELAMLIEHPARPDVGRPIAGGPALPAHQRAPAESR